MGAVDSVTRGRVDDVTTAWLIGIARHKLVDHWRRVERDQRRLTAVADEPATAGRRRPVGRPARRARRPRRARAARRPPPLGAHAALPRRPERPGVRRRPRPHRPRHRGPARAGQAGVPRHLRGGGGGRDDDPFEQLRVDDEPGAPDRRFVAGLRNRLVAALEAAGLPTIDLPDRSTTVTDTATATAAAHDQRPRRRRPSRRTSPSPAARRRSTGTWPCSAPSSRSRYTGDDGRIGHAELTIGGAEFMLSDEYPEFGAGHRVADDARRHAVLDAPRGARRRRRLRPGRRRRPRPRRPASPTTRPTAPARSTWSTRSGTAG